MACAMLYVKLWEKRHELQKRTEETGTSFPEEALCPVGGIVPSDAGAVRETSHRKAFCAISRNVESIGFLVISQDHLCC